MLSDREIAMPSAPHRKRAEHSAAWSLFHDDVDGMDDARDVAAQGQQDVEPEVEADADLEEDAQRRQQNGDEDSEDVQCRCSLVEVGFGNGRTRQTLQHHTAQPLRPPCISPPTTRSWKLAIRTAIGTRATIRAAEIRGQGKAYSPW